MTNTTKRADPLFDSQASTPAIETASIFDMEPKKDEIISSFIGDIPVSLNLTTRVAEPVLK